MGQADDDGADVLGCACGAQGEAIRLHAALTESRREVEALKEDSAALMERFNQSFKVGPSPVFIHPGDHCPHKAENATLRQEVERLQAGAQYHCPGCTTPFNCQDCIALRRQVEEQAAKLAEWREFSKGVADEQQRLIRERDEALAMAHICDIFEGRSADYWRPLLAQAESSLAAMTRERDAELNARLRWEGPDGHGARWCQRVKDAEAERDAALSRAEALEKALVRITSLHCFCSMKDPNSEHSDYCHITIADAALAAPSEPKEGGA
jgi:hypothetical protein